MAHNYHIGYLECLHPYRMLRGPLPLQIILCLRFLSHLAPPWWVDPGEVAWVLTEWRKEHGFPPSRLEQAADLWPGVGLQWAQASWTLGLFHGLRAPIKHASLNFPGFKDFEEAESPFVFLTQSPSSQAVLRRQGKASQLPSLQNLLWPTLQSRPTGFLWPPITLGSAPKETGTLFHQMPPSTLSLQATQLFQSLMCLRAFPERLH